MFSIDRSSNTPVRDQIVEQLRYQIVSGQHKVGDQLPSTRKLADRIDTSFHTVRKAYQVLRDEGLVEAQKGRGYVVQERITLSKSERMERGASIVSDALQRLIGLGMDEVEIEFLFQEQLALLDHAGLSHKILLVAPFREMAQMCATQLAATLQRSVEPAVPEDIRRHADADYIFTTYDLLQSVQEQVPRSDVRGLTTYLAPDAMEEIARLLEHETLGLIVHYADSIPPLTKEIRRQTGFSGNMIAASVDESVEHLQQFIEETDWIVYTSASKRRLLSLLDETTAHTELQIVVSKRSLDSAREAVPA